MKRAILYVVLGLAICGLAQPPIATAKGKAARPLQIQAQGQVDFLAGTGSEAGQISHGGLFSNEWSATGLTTLAGVLTVANGDELSWVGDINVVFTDPTHTTFVINLTITGGTGRFEGATGLLVIAGTGEQIAGPVYGFTYTGTGTLSY
jgi:hypothetical protein